MKARQWGWSNFRSLEGSLEHRAYVRCWKQRIFLLCVWTSDWSAAGNTGTAESLSSSVVDSRRYIRIPKSDASSQS